MKNLSSQHMQAKITPEHLRWAQSVDRTLTAGVDMGVATKTDSTGVYNTFEQGNSSGILFRIGSNAGTEKVKWDGAAKVTIQHGLRDTDNKPRKPIGFKLVDKDATGDVWRTAVPTELTISLQASANTLNVTVYIF